MHSAADPCATTRGKSSSVRIVRALWAQIKKEDENEKQTTGHLLDILHVHLTPNSLYLWRSTRHPGKANVQQHTRVDHTDAKDSAKRREWHFFDQDRS